MVWLVFALSLGAVFLLFWLIRHGAATKVASLMYLVPPCTALVAWPLFGETYTVFSAAGMALAMLGVIGDPTRYKEIVFCGYGEPLQRLETVKNLARWVTSRRGHVRINTNGHANLIHRRNIVPELKGIVDSISVSLDAQDKDTYNRICSPAYPDAYDAVLGFIRDVKDSVPDVQVTVVNMPEVDIARCREIAEILGVKFRVRELDVVG